MCCRRRSWRVIISYLCEYACPVLALRWFFSAHSGFLWAPCHNSSQRETSDWPKGTTAKAASLWFDTALSVVPDSRSPRGKKTKMNVLIALRQPPRFIHTQHQQLWKVLYCWPFTASQAYSFNLSCHSGSLTSNHRTAGDMLCPLSFRAGACGETLGRVIVT